jgi:hypothetical protein
MRGTDVIRVGNAHVLHFAEKEYQVELDLSADERTVAIAFLNTLRDSYRTMIFHKPFLALSGLLLLLPPSLPAADAPPDVSVKRESAHLGFSSHGAAFDEGPRQKPWKLDHIGKAHFPITVPRKEIHDEVQMWFDQGNALLHSYWFFEAEREDSDRERFCGNETGCILTISFPQVRRNDCH